MNVPVANDSMNVGTGKIVHENADDLSPSTPVSISPGGTGSPAAPGVDYQVAVAPLLRRTRWLRAYAWLHAVMAVLLTMTFVGVVVAWAFAWVAYLVNQAASLADEARRTGNPALVAKALDRIALHFLVQLALLVEMALLANLVGSWIPSLGTSLPG